MDTYDALSPFRIVANVADSFANLFGVNLGKFLTGGKYDWSNLNKKINDYFSKLEVSNAKQLNEIQAKIESLIGMPGGSNIKTVLMKAKRGLRDKYNAINKQAAEINLKKVRAENLANDLSQAKLGDLGLDRQTIEKRDELEKMLQPENTNKNTAQNTQLDLSEIERRIV